MEHTERVLAYFEKSGEVLRPGAVGEALGLEKKDLDKAIKSLKEEGKIFSPKRCFYQITKEQLKNDTHYCHYPINFKFVIET